jgi:hypothetical protein
MPKWSTPQVSGLAYSHSPISENVDSSAIARIGYDPDDQRLVVTFNSGRSYAYFGVSRQRFTAFEQAESKGRYLNSQIKGRYSFRRLG